MVEQSTHISNHVYITNFDINYVYSANSIIGSHSPWCHHN